MTYAYTPLWFSYAILIFACLLFISVDISRHRSESLNRALLNVLAPLMRDREVHGLAGTSYLLIGVLFSVLLFEKHITLLSLLFLAFADPIASYVGIRYGKQKIFGQKTIEGTLAAFVVCAIIIFTFAIDRFVYIDHLVVIALLGGLIGCLSEAIPVFNLDDNLTFPVLSSVFLWILFWGMNFYSSYPLV